MVTNKNFKMWLYELAANCQVWDWFFLIVIAAVIIVGFIIVPKTLLLYIVLSVIGSVIFLAWIFVWGWYSVWFRYLVYGVAQLVSIIKKVLTNTIMQIFIVVTLVSLGWVQRKLIFGESAEFFTEILKLISAIKILLITAIIFTIKQILSSRKRIFISDFKNNTGRKELKPAINGISARILNEMIRLSKLLRDIDEAQPDQKMGVMDSAVDIKDIIDGFGEIIGPEASVEIHGVGKISLRAIFNFLKKLIHGPILSGSVFLKGDSFILTACLHGGRLKGSWEITIDNLKEIQKFPSSDSEQLIEMTNLLVCRIFTDISRGATPRWQAMKYYTDGLRLYRETLRTEENRIQNLIDAKNAFGNAIRNDSQFVQCFYNFGIIYEKLDSYDAARAAFRKALEVEAENHHCYYRLAYLYYQEKNYFEADWFCRQALKICPTNPEYWNFAAVINYAKWFADEVKMDDYCEPLNIPNENIQYRNVAVVLAWKALCKTIIKGEKTEKKKYIAWLCIRNLAVITGEKKWYRSRFLFRQALFLEQENNDIYFQLGRYYYRKWEGKKEKELEKSYEAFIRVFEDNGEVNDPFSYWAFYLNVSLQLQPRKDLEKKDIENRYKHFQDAVAEMIHNKKKYPDRTWVDFYRDYIFLLSKTFNEIGKNKDDSRIKVLLKYIIILERGKNKIDIYKWRNAAIEEISKLVPTGPDIFYRWIESQIYIIASVIILTRMKEKNKIDVITGINQLKKFYNFFINEEYSEQIKRIGLNNYLAKGYLENGMYNEALTSAREAVRLDPYNQEVRYIIGKIYIDLSDFDQGIKELEIGLNIVQPNPNYIKKFLKEIGEAYKRKGEKSQDYMVRINAFTKSTTYFIQYLDILNDKSSKDEMIAITYDIEEDKSGNGFYLDCLVETHFNLGSVYWELIKYDNAISHYQNALKMAKSLKRNDYILKTLLRIGWIYVELQSFAEAEKIFNNAASDDKEQIDIKDAFLMDIEIAIGMMFSKVERALSFDKNFLFNDTVKDWAANTEISIDTIVDNKYREKARELLALYHECLGRYYFKQGKMDEAEKEFETSIFFMPNPRVYLYLAEFYLNEASESRMGRKPSLLAKAGNACKLCRKNDLRQQYGNELADLEKKLDAPGM
ncbi:MAG TPA: tetratricopeptide repeat protein [Candidatus Kapabacteria bacterium]|nr:tetratricopeptide repeat protein [Candidatus Kapabacteria bacterium]